MISHLTEEQLYVLLDSSSPEAAGTAAHAHLADCSLCRGEFCQLQQSVAGFRLAATNASLLLTPMRPAVGIATASGRFFGFPPAMRTVWAAGLAAMLAITALAVPALRKPAGNGPTQVVTASTQPPASVSDEALLQDIDSDLSTSLPPSLQPLDTIAASETASTTNR